MPAFLVITKSSLKFHDPTSLFLSFFKLYCTEPNPWVILSKLLEVKGWLVYVINPAQSFCLNPSISRGLGQEGVRERAVSGGRCWHQQVKIHPIP